LARKIEPTKPLVMLLNFPEPSAIKELRESASWDESPNYAPYGASSRFLPEYDAVVWRTPNPIISIGEMNRQLDLFLMDGSKIFIFFICPYACQSGSLDNSTLGIVKYLLKSLDSGFEMALKFNKKGRNLVLTSEGQVSPFREFLEYESQQWFLSIQKRPWLVPLAIDSENESVAFSLANSPNHAFFLPPPVNTAHAKIFLQNLLESINRSTFKVDPVPTWTDKFSLPGIKEKTEEIYNAKFEISKIKEKVVTHKSELDQLKWKRDTLLSGTGKNLENAIEKVLSEIGYNPIPGPAGQEDFTFEHDGKHFLLEVKGVTSSANEGHIKQLHAKQSQFINEHKIDIKGVLIINPWRQYEPSQRHNKDRVVFPEPMMDLVKIYRFCLMTTLQLLAIYRLHLEHKLDLDQFSKDMDNTIGPLKGYSLEN